MKTRIYTDGGCFPNPGRGGWGFVVVQNGKEIHRGSGKEKFTTNNRMELTAVIKGLEYVNKKNVVVYSDSRYITDAFNKHWVDSWVKTGFKNGTIKNMDLWMRLMLLNEKLAPTFKWVRGHSGDKFNEIADRLASR